MHVTGALLDANGRGVRIGAEGFLARRSPIVASGFGLQHLITDADVGAALIERRAELPGQPLAWQVALQQLLRGILPMR
jgi:hypothetical protein